MRSKDLPVKTGGIKHDHGKPRPDLILRTMARAMLAVSEVAAFGAAKYDDDNWLLVDDAKKRYADAKARHMLQGAFESHDDESGLLHAAHEAWNALALLELKLRERGFTDASTSPNWPAGADERIDVIGQNGNDGEHYRDALIGKPASCGIIIGFEGDDAIIMSERDLGSMSWFEAIKACKVLEYNGLGDWLLPSKDQLNLAWLNRDKLRCLELDGWYWSSSQNSEFYAWFQGFSDGTQLYAGKANTTIRVRPVRRVKIENLEFEDSEAAPEARPSSSEIVTKNDLLRGDWWCADTSETARQAFELRGFNVADQWELEDLDGCRLTGKESVTRFKGMSKTKDLREITLVDGEFYYCKAQSPGDE